MSAVLHSHLAGRGVRLRHVRGGKERPVVFSDDSYDFNFQVRRGLLFLMVMVHAAVVVIVVAVSTLEIVNSLDAVHTTIFPCAK